MGYIRDGEGIMNNCRGKKIKGTGKKGVKKKSSYVHLRKCAVNKEWWVGGQMLGQEGKTWFTDIITKKERKKIDAM
jgi:hypothetical protein